MNAVATDAGLTIAKQPFVQQPKLRYVAAAWLVGGTVFSACLAGLRDDPVSARAILLRFPAMFFLAFGFGVWGAYVMTFDAQLSPANIQLVPGLRRHVSSTALVLWAWMSAFLGLEIVAFGVPLLIALTLTTAVLAVSASRAGFARALSILFFSAILVLCSYPFRWAPPLWVGVVALITSSIGGAWWIAHEVGANAEARAVPYERSYRNMRRVREPNDETGWAAFLRRTHLEDRAFARLLRHPSPPERALQGLGSTFHWGRAIFAGPFATTAAFLSFSAIMVVIFRIADEGPHDGQYMLIYPFNMAFAFTASLADSYRQALWSRRKEETLLVLIPGVPRGPEQNGWLMRALLARYAVAVALTYAVVGAATFALGNTSPGLLKQSAAPLAASLFVPSLLLRNYAAMNRPLPMGLVALPGAALVVAEFCIALRSIALDPMLVLAASVAVSPMVFALRYAHLRGAPPAFPAGRLAS